MGPLKNNRRERFCLALAEGVSQAAAYQKAGYKQTASCAANAARLIAIDSVKARVAELKAEAAANNQVTVQSLLQELELARSKADSLDQLSAAVKATSEKAKISGLMTQRIEVTHIDKVFADTDTVEQIAERYAWYYEDRHIELTESQRVEFGRLMSDAIDGFENFLASCTAKPMQISAPAKPLSDYDRRRSMGLLPRSNGR